MGTRIYGLIGYPLSHSFSRQYFTDKFTREGITDAQYCNFPIREMATFRDLLASRPELCGLNVTIPHKSAVIPFLDELDPEAAAVGAVNVIRIQRLSDGLWLKGYNSDVYGFRASLQSLLQEPGNVQAAPAATTARPEPAGSAAAATAQPVLTGSAAAATAPLKALVLGSGGASKAVVYGLRSLNIEAHIVSRKEGEGVYRTYRQLTPRDLQEHLLLINTTPLGMFPRTETFPLIPYESITPGHILFDLVYNPEETVFLKWGKTFGARTLNGLEMLRLQAERSWEIWSQR
jgi:shikimate dehydrogenase